MNNAKEEAARYSGGLLLALKQANVATQENAITMLEYRKSLAKYGFHKDEITDEAISSGMNDIIVKPFEPVKLFKIINYLIIEAKNAGC